MLVAGYLAGMFLGESLLSNAPTSKRWAAAVAGGHLMQVHGERQLLKQEGRVMPGAQTPPPARHHGIQPTTLPSRNSAAA